MGMTTTEMTVQQEAIFHLASTCRTRYPRDLEIQALMIRGARTPEERAFTIECILAARAYWLDWLTVGQRKWQSDTRRPSRARHHDSIEIREKYVRC